MDWLFDHFQLVVLVGLALASWLKHRMDAKTAEREERGEMPDAEDVFGPGEGWGPTPAPPLPSVPPPLVRQVPPPLVRDSTPQYSRESEAEVILKRQLDMQERIRQIKASKATTSGGASATRARVAASQSHAKAAQPGKSGLRGVLRNPKEIRRAIVMREILGPPVGLR